MRPLILVPTINYRHWNACYLQLLSVDCTEMPAPPTGRALLLGGGSAMALDVQGGYRAVCGRSKLGRAVAEMLMMGRVTPKTDRQLAERLRSLWQRLRAKHTVTWRHVEGHSGNKWNNYVDELAAHGRQGG